MIVSSASTPVLSPVLLDVKSLPLRAHPAFEQHYETSHSLNKFLLVIMALKCSRKRQEETSPPLRTKTRNPLDVLAEKCKDLPVSTADVIAEVKRLAVSLSCRGIESVNDEVKGEIAELVAAIYRGRNARIASTSSTPGDEASELELKSQHVSGESDIMPLEIEKWFSRPSLHGEQSFVDGDRGESEEKVEERSLFRDSDVGTDDGKLSCSRQWLIETFGTPLKMAMKEIVAKKPYDPVSYLGFWLLNYRQREEDALKRFEMEEELRRFRSAIKPPSLVEEDKQVAEEAEEGGGQRDWNFQQYETEDSITFI